MPNVINVEYIPSPEVFDENTSFVGRAIIRNNDTEIFE